MANTGDTTNRDVSEHHGVVAVHVSAYKKDKKNPLKSRHLYGVICLVIFGCLGVWYLGQSIAGSESVIYEPSQVTGTTKNSNATEGPTKPQISAELGMGFLWDRLVFHYGLTLNYSSLSTDGIKSYNVVKNGTEVYSGQEMSYRDYDIASDQIYTYEVQAQSYTGGFSEKASYTVQLECDWVICRLK